MGLTRLSAMTIQSNEVMTEAKGPYDNGKWGMTIMMLRDGEIHREIVSVDYGYFKTKEEAKKMADDLVTEVRELGDKIHE